MRLHIVISGSFRKHLQDIGIALANFKKSNVEVLAPLTQEAGSDNADFVFLATDDPEKSADVLEKEFLANINKADFLYLANVEGYVGQSAATEMSVAVMGGIPVVTAQEIKDFSDDIPSPAQELLKKSVFQQLPIKEVNSEKIAALNLKSFKPINLSLDQTTLLQTLVEKLLENLKFVKMTI